MMERKPLEEERGKISVSVVHSRSLPRTHLSSGGMADVFSSSWKEEKEAILIDSDDEALLISGCDDIKTVEEFSSPRVTWCLDTPSGHHHTKEEESSHTADKFPDDGGGVQIECGFSHRQNESNEEESDLFFPFDDEEEIEWLSGEEEEEDVQTTTQLRRQRRTRRYFLWNSTERKFEETSQYDGGTPYPSHETINKNDDAPLSVSASPSELSNEFSATTREQKNTAHLPHPHSSSSSLASSSSSSSASSSSSLLPKSLRHTFSDTEQHLSSSPSSSSLLVAIPGFGVHVKGLPSWFALPLTHPRTPEAVRDLWRRVTRDLQAYQTFSLSPHTPGDSADKKDRREEETQSCLSSSPSSSPQSSSFFCVAQGSRDKTGCNEGGEKDNHSRLSPSMDSPEGGEKENERDNREKEDVCCLPWKPTCALEKAGYPSWVYLSSDVTFPSPEHANELWGQIARDVHTLRLEKKRRLRQRNATIASREERESVINRTEENKKRRSGEGESVSKRGNDGGCEEVKSSHVRMKTCHTMDQAKERADDYVNEKQPCIIITGEKNRTLLQQEKQADGSARGVYTPGGNNMLSNCTNPLQQSSKKAGSSEFVSKLLVRSKPLSSFLSHTNKKTGFSFSGSSMLKATAGGRDLPATSLRKADAPTTEGSVERRKAFLRSREEENGEGHISSSLQKKQKTGTSLSYLISDPTARQTASAKLPQKPRPGGQGNGAVTKKQNGGEVDKRDVKGNSTNSRHGGGVYVPLAERLRPASLEEFVGQRGLTQRGKGTLRELIEADRVSSLILWGPPGCGKTTFALLLGARGSSSHDSKKDTGPSSCSSSSSLFKRQSAVTCGVNEIRKIVQEAQTARAESGQKTFLFLDEIHRFNKAQQDALLPHVEDGTIVLIGATTENPSFEVNRALLSRCRVCKLEPLSEEDLKLILRRAANLEKVVVTEDALHAISSLADGDARRALNMLENAINYCRARQHGSSLYRNTPTSSSSSLLSSTTASSLSPSQPSVGAESRCTSSTMSSSTCGSFLSSSSSSSSSSASCDSLALSSERQGKEGGESVKSEEGERISSLLLLRDSQRSKDSSQRKEEKALLPTASSSASSPPSLVVDLSCLENVGSDEHAAVYYLARMLEAGEDPLKIARRIVRMASEDVGLANPQALPICVAAYQTCHFTGMPECNTALAMAVIYLCHSPKSNAVEQAYNKAKSLVMQYRDMPVPLHIRNAPTQLMRQLGYAKGYVYTNQALATLPRNQPPEFRAQTYLPQGLLGMKIVPDIFPS